MALADSKNVFRKYGLREIQYPGLVYGLIFSDPDGIPVLEFTFVTCGTGRIEYHYLSFGSGYKHTQNNFLAIKVLKQA